MLRYELAGLARKPLTEVVATAPLMAVLALTLLHHAPDRPRGAAGGHAGGGGPPCR